MFSICRISPYFSSCFSQDKIGFKRATKKTVTQLVQKKDNKETSFFSAFFSQFCTLQNCKGKKWFQKGIICVGCLPFPSLFIQSFNDIIFSVLIWDSLKRCVQKIRFFLVSFYYPFFFGSFFFFFCTPFWCSLPAILLRFEPSVGCFY